ncbi:MAG: sulfatase-like hydrolase/transferase [Victivallales bacterium]|nr:sulfatase-like hydrolase/transferase [Victivallales bacterium]
MRPNILMIVADQHRRDCVGVNGHPFLQTPNLDALAASGVNFTHAFTSAPICVPARNSLLHGVWSCKHLAIANADTEACRPAADIPSFPQAIRDAGYHLSFIGKWLGGKAKSPLEYGFHDYIPESDYGKWRAAQGLPPRPSGMPFFGFDEAITPEQSRLYWGASQTIETLKKQAGSDTPFLIRWDPSEPHLPNVVPQPYADMYKPSDIPPWPSFGDTFKNKPYIQAQQLRSWNLDGWTWEQWAPLVGRYLGESSLLDAQVGRILKALDDLKLADNTIVVYTCDHGDMCGAHGMIDKHYIMYEDVTRVPFIVRWPGVAKAGTSCDDFVVHTIDLARSLCEMAGAEVPETFQGKSILPMLKGEGHNGREDVHCMYHGNQFGLYSQRMVRDRRWKYVWNGTAEDELYDLETDPGELVNRATDPACQERIAAMRKRLHEWMVETGDPLNNGWVRNQLLNNKKL